MSEIEKLRSSKYAQSGLNTIFSQIETLLKHDKKVVFTGTPCQVAGLRSFLRKDYTNLYLIDLVCRSIPSPKLWKAYLEWQKEKYGADITAINCRSKTYGYHSGTLTIDFANGKHYSGSNRVDFYMKSFHHDICSRPSCYECRFKTVQRCSDFTVFDSWQPQMVTQAQFDDNNKGYSNVIVRSEKGQKLLNELQGIVTMNADAEKMFFYTGNMESKSIDMPVERAEFYQNIDKFGFEKGIRIACKVTLTDQIIEGLKPIRYKIQQRQTKGKHKGETMEDTAVRVLATAPLGVGV